MFSKYILCFNLKILYILTPTIPPIMPHTIELIHIIIEYTLNEKSPFRILDNMYITHMYIKAIIIPLINPLVFIFIVPIELPKNMLIAVIIIIVWGITASEILVYVSTKENTNKIITVKTSANNSPLKIWFI